MFCASGATASTAGRSGVGGTSAAGEREGSGNCTNQTGTVTEVGLLLSVCFTSAVTDIEFYALRCLSRCEMVL